MDNLPALLSIDPNLDDKKLVETSLPHFADPRKSDYLVMRAVSFSHEEAVKILRLVSGDYEGWKVYDPVFAHWEGQNLRHLQRHLGAEIMRAKFMRCVFLQLTIDSEILTKRAFEADEMSVADREDAREAAKRYGASSIAAMLKALEPERDDGPGTGKTVKVEMSVTVTDSDMDQQTAKKAAARQLLHQFTKKVGQVIDESGHVVDDDEDDEGGYAG